ncbi:hypothetical protein QYS36_15020 [Pseudomonas sp. G34]|uniref:hypothetical protein n=1 Tax=Pseudomonas sp. G34 TaxID=3059083 RepID=UPI0028067EE3|nr:hypothetical protein [Pseudomonas sp. G34]MDQ7986250.1 hypothetical protein [Pseudomonas sp. G34]
MIVNILGIFGVEDRGKELIFDSQESRIVVSDDEFRLVPEAQTYVKFAQDDVKVTSSYGDGTLSISGSDGEWTSKHVFLGGSLSYGFFNEKGDQDLYVARTWGGRVIFQIPYFHAENFFGSSAIALGNKDKWSIFDLAGQCIQEVICSGLYVRIGRAHFTVKFFLFRRGEAAEYQIYDVKQQQFTASLYVIGAVFAVLYMPDGDFLLIDGEGIKRLKYDGAATKLETLHCFSLILTTSQADVVVWHDNSRVFVAINYEGNHQLLFALPLQGEGEIEQFAWSNTWSITRLGGFRSGWNYLSLRRKDLLSDNAVMLWRENQPLNAQLLAYDLSRAVTVSQVTSATKGKHGYGITIEDTSSNRAVRTAALELGRLLSEACSGIYNEADVILDRKFDGNFYIEFTTSDEPDNFERTFLLEYIKYFRYFGGLSPAGSKATLAEPILTWKSSAP